MHQGCPLFVRVQLYKPYFFLNRHVQNRTPGFQLLRSTQAIFFRELSESFIERAPLSFIGFQLEVRHSSLLPLSTRTSQQSLLAWGWLVEQHYEPKECYRSGSPVGGQKGGGCFGQTPQMVVQRLRLQSLGGVKPLGKFAILKLGPTAKTTAKNNDYDNDYDKDDTVKF